MIVILPHTKIDNKQYLSSIITENMHKHIGKYFKFQPALFLIAYFSYNEQTCGVTDTKSEREQLVYNQGEISTHSLELA